MFLRETGLRHPYPNIDLGEDFSFVSAFRLPVLMVGMPAKRRVALLQEEFGICCHTLHPKATSGSFARSQVPLEEVLGFDFACMGLFEQYMSRFEKTGDYSRYISGQVKCRERTLQVRSSFGCFPVTTIEGVTLWRPEGLPLGDADRIGLRTTE